MVLAVFVPGYVLPGLWFAVFGLILGPWFCLGCYDPDRGRRLYLVFPGLSWLYFARVAGLQGSGFGAVWLFWLILGLLSLVLSGYILTIQEGRKEGRKAARVDSCSGLNDTGAGVMVSGLQDHNRTRTEPKPGRVAIRTSSNPYRPTAGADATERTTRTNDPNERPERLQPNGYKSGERPNDYSRTNDFNNLTYTIMRPSYIILTDSGERLDLANAYEFNPNEYDLSYEFQDRKIGFYFSPEYPNESYCYTPDPNEDDEPITATTLGFKAYDGAGNVICQDEGGNGIWL